MNADKVHGDQMERKLKFVYNQTQRKKLHQGRFLPD